jgi:8-oxo-dGTP diphosphatase
MRVYRFGKNTLPSIAIILSLVAVFTSLTGKTNTKSPQQLSVVEKVVYVPSPALQPIKETKQKRKPMKRMVVGFCFSEDNQRVVMIKKERPDWQKGCLNGVGGKIEKETAIQAMIREFEEETGVKTKPSDWQQFAKMRGSDWTVQYFRCFNTSYVDSVKTTTDEQVVVSEVSFDMLSDVGVSNVHWLVGLALDDDQPRVSASITYKPENFDPEK